MTRTSLVRGALGITLLAILAGCAPHKGVLQPIPSNTDPLVFDDNFGAGVDWQPFLNSNYEALAIDPVERHTGTRSIRITVLNNQYSGGAFVAGRSHDLSGYNALSFWAKASRNVTMGVAGLGNDNTGGSLYDAHRNDLAITTTWTKITIPVPAPARLTRERGMFYFALAPDAQGGCTLWLDDITFETSPDLYNPRAVVPPQAPVLDVGSNIVLDGVQALFDIGTETDRVVSMSSNYLTLTSSDTTVAREVNGRMQVVGPGTATLTASLGEIPVSGTTLLRAIGAPAEAAPTPIHTAADVISLYSDAYPNRSVDTWSPDWDLSDVSDVLVAGNPTKKYRSGLSPANYAAIEFKSPTVNATDMTHLRLDVWMATGRAFRIKLVDFGPDGVFGGGDDSEHETVAVKFTPQPPPPFQVLQEASWNTFDIPLASMTGLTGRAHLAQIIIKGGDSDTFDQPLPPVYVDNVYFRR